MLVDNKKPLDVEIGIKKMRKIESYIIEVKKIVKCGEENIELYK